MKFLKFLYQIKIKIFMQSSLLEQQKENNSSYITPLSNFRRLIEPNLNETFQIIISPSNIKKTPPIPNKAESMKRKIQITINEARVISKRINELYQIDPTISNYEILFPKDEIKDANEMIELLIKSTREEIEIPKDKKEIFSKVRQFLGENDDEGKIEIKSHEEAISLLNTKFHELALQYFSDHLMESITKGETKIFSESILFDIINCYFNKHKKEIKHNEICQIFNKLKSQNESYKILMHFLIQIGFDEYDDDMLKYFYDHLDGNFIKSDIAQVINILKQFISKLVENNSRRKIDDSFNISNSMSKGKFTITKVQSQKMIQNNIIQCKFNGDELSGIFKYLQKTKGENLGKKCGLKVTGGGFPNPSCPISNLLKYDGDDINEFYYNYSSQNPKGENDSWIQFDFDKRKINLTSYTIRACCHDISNDCKAKSWRIVGSNDGEKWDLLDHQVNCSELTNKYDMHRFECKKTDKYYRYIRYILEETWYTDEHCKYNIHMSCIEFFGSILDSQHSNMLIKMPNNSYS